MRVLYSLSDGSMIIQGKNDEIPLAWVPVEGANIYQLIVLDANDSAVVFRKETQTTSEKVSLKAGKYLWNVTAYGSLEKVGANEDFSDNTLYALTINESQENYSVYYDLHVEPLAARKDSYLLNLKWGEKILEKEWDKPHNTFAYIDSEGRLKFSDIKHARYDDEEHWRCWVVVATMLNHYYGGNITQDEVKFNAFRGRGNDILEAFPMGQAGGGDFTDIINSVTWALQLSNEEIVYRKYSNAKPNPDEIIKNIKAGKPIFIGQRSHLMVVDGIRLNSSGKYEVKFQNTDNNGSFFWRIYENEKDFNSLWIPEKSVNPRNSDYLVSLDSDNDGIMDFDELYRFGTNPNSVDSDGDGIDDKSEIMSYTILEPFEDKIGTKMETYADIDEDGDRAELDYDSDNGGVPDGIEDINKNGKLDPGETSPFKKYDDSSLGIPIVPSQFALYALSDLTINDGVSCYNGVPEFGYCNIASGNLYLEDFSLKIGARANVGNVYSRGNVLFRSNARINGDVLLFNNARAWDGWNRNGTQISGNIQYFNDDKKWLNEMPMNFELPDFVYSNSIAKVEAGQSLHLLDNSKYAFVKVESQGVLYIYPGEMWLDSIQLDAGSKIIFTNPGQQTILHVNGNFQYRGIIANAEEDILDIAKGFKLVLHSFDKRFYIDKLFAGTILAPNTQVILGQSEKKFYGAVVAKDIIVHQYSKVYHVEFNPDSTAVYAFVKE